MIDSYEKCVNYLNNIPKYTAMAGVYNCRTLLDELGSPEKSPKIIHVAGTNGKGSVCAYLSSALIASGKCTGLFTSPHLKDIRERIRLNGEMISKDDFLDCFYAVNDAVMHLSNIESEQIGCEETSTDEIAASFSANYFDWLFAIAMVWYHRKNAEYVVLETGLGGLLDSTNAIEAPVLTIITSISFDHCEVLGNTIAEIASQKAGIIKKGSALVFCSRNNEASEVIMAKAKSLSLPYIGISDNDVTLIDAKSNDKTKQITFSYKINPEYTSGLDSFAENLPVADELSVHSSGLYQMENSSIAYLSGRLLNINDDILKKAILNTEWSGRMETRPGNICFDGAHNPDGIHYFIKSAGRMKNGHPATLLFSAVKEKDIRDMIKEICDSRIFEKYIITSIPGSRTLDADKIAIVFNEFCKCNNEESPVTVIKDMHEAFGYAKKNTPENGLLFITGSLYLIGSLM